MIDISPDHIAATGDDRPVGGLARFVWRMSGWRQALLGALALLAAALGLAPIELQRRLIDDAVMSEDVALLATLGLIYGGVLIAQRLVKFALGLGQGWVGESATLYCRGHLLRLWRERKAERPGEAVTITGDEIDQLGGFVGSGPSQAIGSAGLLLAIVGYMLFTAPTVAALSLALLAPQFVVAPLIQRRINRLTERRVELLRAFGDAVAAQQAAGRPEATAREIYRNRIRLTLWKHALKGALNLLNALAPLGLLLFGGWLAIRGETTVGVLVAFLSGLQRIVEPMRDIIRFYRDCASNGVRHRLIAAWM